MNLIKEISAYRCLPCWASLHFVGCGSAGKCTCRARNLLLQSSKSLSGNNGLQTDSKLQFEVPHKIDSVNTVPWGNDGTFTSISMGPFVLTEPNAWPYSRPRQWPSEITRAGEEHTKTAFKLATPTPSYVKGCEMDLTGDPFTAHDSSYAALRTSVYMSDPYQPAIATMLVTPWISKT